MRIRNVHQRVIAASEEELIRLLAGMSSEEDRIWPRDRWPRMKLDPGLRVGAKGGHVPIQYFVEELTPRRVVFRLTPPASGFAAGLFGMHRFEIEGNTLRHLIDGEIRGWMLLKWPLIVRPLHDALVEDALDRAEASVTGVARHSPHSWWVRILRAILRRQNIKK